ncbi:MAG: TSUP family transporter [Henriciella sp.]|nr:TSUP family transporter [Henriciella sp.]
MPLLTALIILAATLVTSFISGIFGMAGGLILMGVLIAVVSVATAMIVHGAIMMVANGYRAWLLRDAIDWRVFRLYSVGAAAGIAALFFISWVPDKRTVYLILGLAPLLIWLPKTWLHLDIRKPVQAVLAGTMVQGMNTLAGVAGPLLDLFFVRADMTRQEIVATKSVTQTLSHLVKIGFWSVPVISAAGFQALPPIWLLLLAAPVSMIGTRLGNVILRGMTDVNFVAWMKGLVTAIGCIYLLRAAGVL